VTRSASWIAAVLALVPCLTLGAGCAVETSRLTPEQAQRLEAEGILHRAANVVFRRSHDVGRSEAGWREVVASVVVTRQTMLVHRNGRVLLEINPRSRRFLQVQRDGMRVRIRSGGGGSAEVWSFAPPDDPAAWARDMRAVIKGSRSAG
jgi:hypothetical protein